MRLLPNGDIKVGPREVITVRVKKTIRPYLASISDLIGSVWTSVTRPDDLTEVRTFESPVEPKARVTVTIMFDFAPDPSGGYDSDDKYGLEISGRPDEDVEKMTVVPPPIVDLNFTFIVEEDN